MEDVVDPLEGILDRTEVANIADIEIQLKIVVSLPRVILFLLVPGENTDLFDVSLQESL